MTPTWIFIIVATVAVAILPLIYHLCHLSSVNLQVFGDNCQLALVLSSKCAFGHNLIRTVQARGSFALRPLLRIPDWSVMNVFAPFNLNLAQLSASVSSSSFLKEQIIRGITGNPSGKWRSLQSHVSHSILYQRLHAFIDCLFFTAGKTELAKQVARYLHKDNKKVNGLPPKNFFLAILSATKLQITGKQKVLGLIHP